MSWLFLMNHLILLPLFLMRELILLLLSTCLFIALTYCYGTSERKTFWNKSGKIINEASKFLKKLASKSKYLFHVTIACVRQTDILMNLICSCFEQNFKPLIQMIVTTITKLNVISFHFVSKHNMLY